MNNLRKSRWAFDRLRQLAPQIHTNHFARFFRKHGWVYATEGSRNDCPYTDYIGFKFNGSSNIVDSIVLSYKATSEITSNQELMAFYMEYIESIYQYIFDIELPAEISKAILDRRPLDMPNNLIGSCKVRLSSLLDQPQYEMAIMVLINRYE